MELPPRAHFYAIGNHGVPSGFGPYFLAALAQQTKGSYYIVTTNHSPYEWRTLKAYQPELCSPEEYDKRNKSSPLRSAIHNVVSKMLSWPAHRGDFHGNGRPSHWNRNRSRIRRQLAFCEAGIKRLVRLKRESDKEKYARKRWEANYDLTLAQLYKIRFMLLQHRLAIPKSEEELPPLPAVRPPKGTAVYGTVPYGSADGPFPDDREVLNARDKARRALELVVRKHPDTPWAERAQNDIDTLRPVRVQGGWHVPHKTEEMVL
jgi:hypothetical protein